MDSEWEQKRNMAGKNLLWVVLVIVVVFIVYAFGWFGNDPLFSPFDASVSLTNIPPTIEAYVAATEFPDDGATLAGNIRGDVGGIGGVGAVTARYSFVAQDFDGVADLPGLTGPPINLGTNIVVSFTEPLNDATGGITTLSASSCTASTCVADTDCPDSGPGTNQKKYTCDVTMNFYDPPSPNGGLLAADRWSITSQIFDSTGINNARVSSGDPGFTNLDVDYILYDQITGVSTSDILTWSTLDINLDDQKADSGLVLQNVGNIGVANEIVIAQNLSQDGVPSNFIEARAFSVGPAVGSAVGGGSGACDVVGGGGAGVEGIGLMDGIPRGVVIPIAYTSTNTPIPSSNMFFCVWDQLSNGHRHGGPNVNQYVANAVNGNQWVVSFNS